MSVLQGHELVAHVFVAVDGPNRGADQRYVLDLWRHCRERYGLAEEVGPYPGDTPGDLLPGPAAGGMLAVRGGGGPGVQQVVLRRLRDVFVLSLVHAPAPGERLGWPALEREWDEVLGSPSPGTIGTARILQARLTDPVVPVDPIVLGSAVASASGIPGDWPEAGVLRLAAPLGPFAVWEAPPAPDPVPATVPSLPDTRMHRRVVVVAAADHDDRLSAWTWSRGTSELTPLASYLLHAAKVRFELRIRAGGTGRELRARVDAAIAPLLELAEDVGDGGRPDARRLVASSVPLVRLQAGELGLADRASRLREMRRTVEVATRNIAAHAGPEPPGGLFADDADLARWAAQQLDDDVTYLEAALDRARSVTALADQLVQRGIQARREWFNLALTGVVGAILMVLAAMQSLKLEFTLPVPLGGVVSFLGVFALLVPFVLVRLAVADRAWPAVALSVVAGLLVGTVPWTVLTAIAYADGAPVPVVAVVGSGAAAAVVGGVLAWLVSRPRRPS